MNESTIVSSSTLGKKKLPLVLTAITVSESAVLIKTQLAGLRLRGFDVALCSSPGQEVEQLIEEEKIKFFPIKMYREPKIFSDLKSFFKVCKVIFTLKPDIVNAGTPKAGFLFTLAGYLLRTNVRIYHIRGFRHESLLGFRRTFQVLIEKITCQLATHVICLSPSVKDLLIRENLCEASKAYVLGNGGSGTILENFCPEYFSFEDKSVLKANLNISKDELIFGFVGRLVERKGIYDLLDAWSQLKKNIPNSKLLIIGPFEDAQPMLQAYKDLIYNDDSIVYVGQQSNVSQFMSLMDIFCLPAHWEGFGNVLIEAAAMGLPVISTNGTGTRDAVSDGFNGLLTKVKDVDGLLNAMLTYANSLKLRELHGRNGRIWAKNFDRKIVVLNLANFYKSIL